MTLSAGEIALASLHEHFDCSMSTVAENDFVNELDRFPAKAVERATADILGKTDHKRNEFHVGKFPSIDEFLPRCRYHRRQIEDFDKSSDIPRISHTRHATARDAKAIITARQAAKFEGRELIAEGVKDAKAFERGGFPTGSRWDWLTGNVYQF